MAKWYDWFSYGAVTDKGGEYQVVKTPLDHVPVSVRHHCVHFSCGFIMM